MGDTFCKLQYSIMEVFPVLFFLLLCIDFFFLSRVVLNVDACDGVGANSNHCWVSRVWKFMGMHLNCNAESWVQDHNRLWILLENITLIKKLACLMIASSCEHCWWYRQVEELVLPLGYGMIVRLLKPDSCWYYDLLDQSTELCTKLEYNLLKHSGRGAPIFKISWKTLWGHIFKFL